MRLARNLPSTNPSVRSGKPDLGRRASACGERGGTGGCTGSPRSGGHTRPFVDSSEHDA